MLDGEHVLALGRARGDVTVELPDGTRQIDRSGEFGRQDRAAVIAAALLRAVGDTGPADVPALVREGLGQVRVDQGTSAEELVELGRIVGDLEVATYRLPVTEARIDGQDVLELAPGAAEAVDGFLTGASPPAASPPDPTGSPSGARPGDATGLAPC